MPRPLVLIIGDEALLIERAINRSVALARRAAPDTERRDTTAAGLTRTELADLLAPSLFAEPRVLIVRGAHEATKEIAADLVGYAQDPVDGVTLVVQHLGGARNKPVADAFAKAGAQVMKCEKISRPADRAVFVRSEITAAGGTVSSDAVTALLDAVGTDLTELAAAAGQLTADTGGRVDEVSVRRYYQGKAEVSGFTIADLAVAGDVPGALEAARWAFQIGVAHVLIADALADGIRTVAKVSGALGGPGRGGNSYALAAELGLPPWKIDKAKGAARHWSEAGLAAAMAVTAEVNAAVKGRAADPDYAVEKAIIELGRARRLR